MEEMGLSIYLTIKILGLPVVAVVEPAVAILMG